ncbi:MAG: DUF4870 domain-containing protein, partial [Mycobacteriales bacterium]
MDHHADATTPPAEPPAEVSAPENQRVPISEEDRRWTLISHYGASVLLVLTLGTFGWIAGLLVLFLRGSSPIVRAHAVESVNFQLTWGVL